MATVAFGLGGLCAVGGMVGYTRRGSVMSAIGGLSVAAGFAYAGKLLANSADAPQGRVVAMATSAVLGGVMAVRYLRTLKPVPLVLTIVGVGAFTYFAVSEGSR